MSAESARLRAACDSLRAWLHTERNDPESGHTWWDDEGMPHRMEYEDLWLILKAAEGAVGK